MIPVHWDKTMPKRARISAIISVRVMLLLSGWA